MVSDKMPNYQSRKFAASALRQHEAVPSNAPSSFDRFRRMGDLSECPKGHTPCQDHGWCPKGADYTHGTLSTGRQALSDLQSDGFSKSVIVEVSGSQINLWPSLPGSTVVRVGMAKMQTASKTTEKMDGRCKASVGL